VIFIQQYYSNAPKFFIDDVIKKEKALPSGAALIVRGKGLPRELIPFLKDSPASVTRYLGPLPRGVERKVLGARFLLLDSRLIVQDVVYLPTVIASNRRK
jgi:hypothetical protein